eukprot:3082367-Prorocentrum_lima.AAC.1
MIGGGEHRDTTKEPNQLRKPQRFQCALQVARADVVLRNRDRILQVKNAVPPPWIQTQQQ